MPDTKLSSKEMMAMASEISYLAATGAITKEERKEMANLARNSSRSELIAFVSGLPNEAAKNAVSAMLERTKGVENEH